MELKLGTHRDARLERVPGPAATTAVAPAVVRTGAGDWIAMLPVLQSGGVTLRELRLSDAASLFEALATDEVARFVSPPPTTPAGFERFIAWTHATRREGRYCCFAVVPRGLDRAVGLLQLKALTPDFSVAEWGFAIGAQYWGSGLFSESAQLTVDFAVDLVGVHRLEARAVTVNGRGNGALAKLGAVREAILRQSFEKGGQAFDQYLWSILATEWKARRGALRWRSGRALDSVA